MKRFTSTFFALALALLVAVALIPVGAFGQAISGNIVGTVTDSSGAVVTNAEVEATNIGTNVTHTTKTNGSGGYRFDNLLAGDYKITVKAPGFKTTSVTSAVQLNTTGTANVALEPGATTETIEVSGEAPILDTTTPQIQSTYEERQLQDLPTASSGGSLGSGVLNLSLLQSGVGSSGGLGAGSGPAIGGQRPRDNNFMVEGVDNNNKGVTGPVIYVPNDALSNFTILQNQFSSEFGHSNGGQFNMAVQSGNNTFHGRLYEYFQNRNLNAVDTSLANQGIFKNPRFDNNRFGGQVGGPIVKNKLFFFFNYERNPVGRASSPGSPLLAPTSAGYAAAAAVPGVSTANLSALQQFAVAPSACTAQQITDQICPAGGALDVGGTPVQVGILPLAAPNYINLWDMTASVDYNIGDKDQVRGRYVYNNFANIDTGITGVTLPVFFTVLSTPQHMVALSEFHTFSPSVSNELRVGFNRTGTTWTVPNLSFLPTLDAFPNLTFDDLGGLNIGPDPNAPQYAVQNLYQAVDNVTWAKGGHTLKFGIEGRKYISPQKFIQRSRGDYEYANFSTFAFDQIPDGGVNERSFGTVGYSGDQYEVGWFVNDIWKVRPNLSLNLGLRYEYTSTPFGWTQQSLNSVANVPGLITFGSPQAPKKDFMPRVGFAYSPGSGGNTSIRGGFGMGYDVLYDNIGVLSRPPQIGNTVDCPVTCSDPFLATGGIPLQSTSGITVLDAATARANTSSYLPNQVRYPVSLTWNLGVQRVFHQNYTAEVRYVGTRGEDLNVQNRINVISPVTAGHSLPTFLQAPSQATLDALTLTQNDIFTESYVNGGYLKPDFLNAGFFSEIVAFMPWGSSTYHGLQAQLNRRFVNGLQLQAAWTWSHTIDNSTADFFSTVITPRRPQDFQNLPSERSNSILDHAHRITISAIYEMPWYKGSSNWFKKNVLGNYEFAPIYTWESGQWGTVQSGLDSNANTDGAADRAVFNPTGVPGTGSDITDLTNTNGDIVAYLANNPTAQYITAGFGALATSSRNTLRTPPINNWDMTLAKHISLTERVRWDIIAQLSNAFNHPQYTTGLLNDVLSFGITGQAQRNYFIPSAANFNQAKVTFPSNARTMTLGMKFIF
jgi:hypothetical protein